MVTSADVEKKCDIVILNGVKLLKNIIPSIKHLVSPILDSANSIKSTLANNILYQTPTSSDGFWNTIVYVNVCTAGLHTERDCTYTLITVPKQSFNIGQKPLKHKPMLLFKLKDNQHLILPLVSSLALYTMEVL